MKEQSSAMPETSEVFKTSEVSGMAWHQFSALISIISSAYRTKTKLSTKKYARSTSSRARRQHRGAKTLDIAQSQRQKTVHRPSELFMYRRTALSAESVLREHLLARPAYGVFDEQGCSSVRK